MRGRLTERLGRPSPWGVALALVLLASLGLRLWGLRSGLPYAYNADENAHFVPRAIGLFGHDWNPDYFVNPPAYTYLLHVVFAVWFGGGEGVSRAFATDPGSVFAVARVVSAVLGTAAVGLVYLAGVRFFDRRVGLLAAALLGVSFLPVFYGHLALNDAPTLAPVALALWGVGGILRDGRRRDYAVAGLGIGLAAATKYTGGIVLLPALAAVLERRAASTGRRAARTGGAVLLGAAVAGFLAANPYAILDAGAFWDGLAHQTSATGADGGKLGLTQDNGVVYYLWTLTWGVGWAPALAALLGALALLRLDRMRALVLVPGPVLFLLFMGLQERYFGRWLLPVVPIVCLLAAVGVVALVQLLDRRRPRLRATALAAGAVALCAQGVAHSVHLGRVMARDDTRGLTRAWMVANIPIGARIVIEPVAPDGWAQDIGHPTPSTRNGNRWVKFPVTRSTIDNTVVAFEDYEGTLRPELIDRYERSANPYCWVVTGSTQRGRAEAEPEKAPGAIAYYRALERRGDLVFRSSPYGSRGDHVAFNFDWSFDYYPLAYYRPGPVMSVYRLRGGRCAGVS